ncbi:MAG: UbiA family prenyltransferase [Magnetococcus sp. WYHC-3]
MMADAHDPVPLVVDLDGTLLNTDLMLEGLLAMAGTNPFLVPGLLWRNLHDRAALKAELVDIAPLNIDLLPLNNALLARLRQEKQQGRHLVLASAADERLAQAVAQREGLFDTVLASDGRRNLKGAEKARELVARYGVGGFDYVGDAMADLPVWQQARQALVVARSPRVLAAARRVNPRTQTIVADAPGAPWQLWIHALRLHQWVKNSLLFIPLLAAHRFDPPVLLATLAAFIAFGLCASSVYLLNDLLDLDADRRHPDKRLRPVARGSLWPWTALAAVPALLTVAMALATWVGFAFLATLGLYYVVTLGYSLGLKRVMLLDMFLLAGLFTLRIFSGAAASGIPVSHWLLVFSINLFLGLALLKRFVELRQAQTLGLQNTPGRDYRMDDLPILAMLGTACGHLAVLVLILYIDGGDVRRYYAQPQWLWPLALLLLYWNSRLWLLAQRGQMQHDPVLFALSDRTSHVIALLAAVCYIVATLGWA